MRKTRNNKLFCLIFGIIIGFIIFPSTLFFREFFNQIRLINYQLKAIDIINALILLITAICIGVQSFFTRKILQVSKIPEVDFYVISGKTFCGKNNKPVSEEE